MKPTYDDRKKAHARLYTEVEAAYKRSLLKEDEKAGVLFVSYFICEPGDPHRGVGGGFGLGDYASLGNGLCALGQKDKAVRDIIIQAGAQLNIMKQLEENTPKN